MSEPAPTFTNAASHASQPLTTPTMSLETMFDILAVELALFDAHPPYRCLRHNQQFLDLLDDRWQRDALEDVPLDELFAAVANTAIQEIVAHVITTGEHYKVSQKSLLLRSGIQRSFYRWSLLPIHDQAGALTGLLLLAQIHPAGRVVTPTPPPSPARGADEQIPTTSAAQRLLHELLETSESHYRTIWAATNDAMVLSNPHGVVVEANRAYQELYGYTEDQLIGHDFAIIFPEELRAWAMTEYETAFWTAPEETRFESPVIRSDGSQRIVESHVSFLIEHGQRVAMLSTIRDITERKTMEQALNESDQRYRMLVDLAPVGIFETDVGGGCIFVNDFWQSLTGLSQAEAMQGGWIKALHPADRAQVLQSWAEMIQTAEPFDHEYRYCLPNGQVNWVIVQVTPIRNTEGAITGYLGVSLDVTGRRKMEDQARHHNLRYQSVVAAMGEGIVIHRQDGTIETANAAATRILGLTVEQMEGVSPTDPLWNTIHPDGSPFPGAEHPAMVTLRTGQALRDIPMGIQKPDSSTAWISINAQPLFDPALNATVGVVASFVDMTAYRNAQAQLQASLTEKEVLLKEVHHRVKNNLQVIISLLRLQALPLTDATIKDQFRDTQNRVHAMALVHEQLYGTHDLAHIDFAPYVANLAAVVLRSYTVPYGQVKLTQAIDPDLVLTIDMAAPLGLILTELLSNSLKYAFPSEIIIQAQHSPTGMSLVVQDDGVGLPPERDLAEIMSLGLQLVHRLVSQIGGELAIGGPPGTIFQITIPLVSKENHV